MIEKFFLALDFPTDDEAVEVGGSALSFLKYELGENFLRTRVGIKINEDLLTGPIDPRHRDYYDVYGCEIFADLKICHGADTGERIVERLTGRHGGLPVNYLTVSAGLGVKVLKEYSDIAHRRKINLVAFTAHTKMPPDDVRRVYSAAAVSDAVLNLGLVAYDGGCDAIVLDGERLQDERIRELKLKKLVAGIRIDPKDAGSQGRVTSLSDIEKIKGDVDYVVVSSRYIKSPADLKFYIVSLL